MEIWQQLRAMGEEFTPASILATQKLFAPLALTPAQAGAAVQRNLAYGTDPRHRLDVFAAPVGASRPVVVFVHGGGFVGGDKGGADAPFYNNVGAWAVRSGFVGVTMTYRLAPAAAWPAGAADVAAAMQWLRANIAGFGGDATRILLVGQSAGATHVAGYLAGHGGTGDAAPAVMAAALLSGFYEPNAFHGDPMQETYFGTDRSRYPAQSAVLALAASTVPCLFTISEFDLPLFHAQLAAVFAARVAMRGRSPQVLYLHGHNHFSSSLQLGSAIDTLGPSLVSLVQASQG
ncbi:MAG TPA: carboxylesterase family protein [Steroidobacteraceae bacterium]|nr:carboxylesterase family protein [Steroidobacteraceae bacterium]